MSKLVYNFIGKDCIIEGVDFAYDVEGIIRSIEDNWIEVETDSGMEIVNLNYVYSISENEEIQKGKKKGFFE